MALFYELTL